MINTFPIIISHQNIKIRFYSINIAYKNKRGKTWTQKCFTLVCYILRDLLSEDKHFMFAVLFSFVSVT